MLPVRGHELWKKIGMSMELVQQRLLKAVRTLEAAEIAYAVVGGNAVRIWVAQVDPSAVRATNDVNILIRPEDLDEARQAMESAGFHYRHTAGLDIFVEDENESARNGIHIVLAGQMVRLDDTEPNPDVEPFEIGDELRTLPLEGLVRMKLNSFRLKDRVHLLDMIDVGLIDGAWVSRFPAPLADRLQDLVDNPDQ